MAASFARRKTFDPKKLDTAISGPGTDQFSDSVSQLSGGGPDAASLMGSIGEIEKLTFRPETRRCSIGAGTTSLKIKKHQKNNNTTVTTATASSLPGTTQTNSSSTTVSGHDSCESGSNSTSVNEVQECTPMSNATVEIDKINQNPVTVSAFTNVETDAPNKNKTIEHSVAVNIKDATLVSSEAPQVSNEIDKPVAVSENHENNSKKRSFLNYLGLGSRSSGTPSKTENQPFISKTDSKTSEPEPEQQQSTLTQSTSRPQVHSLTSSSSASKESVSIDNDDSSVVNSVEVGNDSSMIDSKTQVDATVAAVTTVLKSLKNESNSGNISESIPGPSPTTYINIATPPLVTTQKVTTASALSTATSNPNVNKTVAIGGPGSGPTALDKLNYQRTYSGSDNKEDGGGTQKPTVVTRSALEAGDANNSSDHVSVNIDGTIQSLPNFMNTSGSQNSSLPFIATMGLGMGGFQSVESITQTVGQTATTKISDGLEWMQKQVQQGPEGVRNLAFFGGCGMTIFYLLSSINVFRALYDPFHYFMDMTFLFFGLITLVWEISDDAIQPPPHGSGRLAFLRFYQAWIGEYCKFLILPMCLGFFYLYVGTLQILLNSYVSGQAGLGIYFVLLGIFNLGLHFGYDVSQPVSYVSSRLRRGARWLRCKINGEEYTGPSCWDVEESVIDGNSVAPKSDAGTVLTSHMANQKGSMTNFDPNDPQQVQQMYMQMQMMQQQMMMQAQQAQKLQQQQNFNQSAVGRASYNTKGYKRGAVSIVNYNGNIQNQNLAQPLLPGTRL